MRQLNKDGQYPSELWEETTAPAWSAERVWERMMELQEPPNARPNYWKWGGGGLLILLTSVLLYGAMTVPSYELAAFPVGQLKTRPTTPQSLVPTLPEREVWVPPTPSVPAQPTIKVKQPNPETPRPTPNVAPTPTDTLHRSLPVANIPAPGALPPVRLAPLEERITALPAASRPGTKLTLRLPELPPEDVDPTYAKRLWTQFKRLQNQGEVDWRELGLERNADGTFSIIIPVEKTTEKQDN